MEFLRHAPLQANKQAGRNWGQRCVSTFCPVSDFFFFFPDAAEDLFGAETAFQKEASISVCWEVLGSMGDSETGRVGGGEEVGEEEQAAECWSGLCGFLDPWDTAYTFHQSQRCSQNRNKIIQRDLLLSTQPCSENLQVLKAMIGSLNRCNHRTSALSSLSGVPKPSTLPMLHQTQHPLACPTAKHRRFATGEVKFLLLLTSLFTTEFMMLHSSIFTLFSASWGESKGCVGCVTLDSFQKLGFEIAWFSFPWFLRTWILLNSVITRNVKYTGSRSNYFFLNQIGMRQVARLAEAASTCTSHLFQLKVVDMSLLFNFGVGGAYVFSIFPLLYKGSEAKSAQWVQHKINIPTRGVAEYFSLQFSVKSGAVEMSLSVFDWNILIKRGLGDN